jgi:energy-coupling factor transport system permease protein
MSLSVDLYIPAVSWLHGLDPRVKLMGAVVGSAVAFLLPGPLALLIYLALVIGVMRLGHVPIKRIRWALRSLLPLTVLILLIQPWFVADGRELFALGPARLTTGGITVALVIAIRANVLALLALLPLFTTRHDDLVRGLVQIGLPYNWGLTITLALRYIPIAASLYTTIRQAQEARGLDVTRGGILTRARQFVPVLTALVIQSVRLSDYLAMAMTVRGLNSGPRTERRVLTMQRADWLAAAIITLGLAGVILMRVG